MVKVYCITCKKRCRGDVLKIDEYYLHPECFQCAVCHTNLEKGGFYRRENDFYCIQDYQARFGVRCGICKELVLGEVVTVFGNAFHTQCFKCHDCRELFHSGERATLWEGKYLCSRCWQIKETHSDATHSNGKQSSVENEKNGLVSSKVTTKPSLSEVESKSFSPSVSTAQPSSTKMPPVTHHWVQNYQLTSDSEGASSDCPFEPPVKHENETCSYATPGYLTQSSSIVAQSQIPLTREVPHSEKTMSLMSGFGIRTLPSGNVARRRHRSAGPYEPKYSYDYGRFYVHNYLQLESDGDVSGSYSSRDRYRRSGMTTPTPASHHASSPHFHRPPDRPFSYRTRIFHVDKPKGQSLPMTPTNHKRAPFSSNGRIAVNGMTSKSSRPGTAPPPGAGTHRPHSRPAALYEESPPSILPPHPHSEAECPESVEPKRLSLYPGGHEPRAGDQPPIERQDWPAPPSPAVMLIERFRQKCASLPPPSTTRYRSMLSCIATESLATDEVSSEDSHASTNGLPSSAGPQRKSEMNGWRDTHPISSFSMDESVITQAESWKEHKQKQILADAISLKSGIAQALLQDLRKSGSRSPSPILDPISSSRAPGANLEPPFRPRYEKHTFASPSRDSRRDRMDIHHVISPMEYSYTGGRWRNMPSCPTSPRTGTLTSTHGYVPGFPPPSSPYMGVTLSPQASASAQSILHSIKAASLPSRPMHNIGRETASSCYEMNHHRLDILSPTYDHCILAPPGSHPHMQIDTPYTRSMATLSGTDSAVVQSCHEYYPVVYSVQSWLRPSPFSVLLPTVFKPEPPPLKIYSYKTLVEADKGELRGVDFNKKEAHLSDEEFVTVFQMSRDFFAQLPIWKQNDLKKRVRLY